MPRVDTYLQFIAANTRRWRMRRGLTQHELAASADVDLRFLQRIERGSTNFSTSVLIALADALDVGPTTLFQEATLMPARRGRPPLAATEAEARAVRGPAGSRRRITGQMDNLVVAFVEDLLKALAAVPVAELLHAKRRNVTS